jgi:hypothetical protein
MAFDHSGVVAAYFNGVSKFLRLDAGVVLLAHAWRPDGRISVHTAAWYDKSLATFVDVSAAVRDHLCGASSYSPSIPTPHPRAVLCSELPRPSHG